MALRRIKSAYRTLLAALRKRANRWTSGWSEVVLTAVRRFNEHRAAEAAAALAYYALFSFFPLVLFALAAGSLFADSEEALAEIIALVHRVIPTARQLIAENLQQVVKLRGPVGVAAAATLLWSASGFFGSLARNVNLAWPGAPVRNFVQGRLVAVGMVASLLTLLATWSVYNAVLSVLYRLDLSLGNGLLQPGAPLRLLLSKLAPWVLSFALYVALYRLVPRADVGWLESLVSALLAAAAWRGLTSVFTRYLTLFLDRYRLVYGSLGTVVALLFWVYWSGWITLFGAHLAAAISMHLERPHTDVRTRLL